MVKSMQQAKRIFWLVVFFTLVVCACILGKQQYELYCYRKNEAAMKERIVKLQEEEQRLLRERALLNEPAYLEKLAREEYNMVGKNEIPIVIVENEPSREENRSK